MSKRTPEEEEKAQDLRQEALYAAIKACPGLGAYDVVEAAKAFEAYLLGKAEKEGE